MMQPSLCEDALCNAPCLCVSVHLYVCLSISLSVCLCIHPSVYMSYCDCTLFKNNKAIGSQNIVLTIGLYTFLFKLLTLLTA